MRWIALIRAIGPATHAKMSMADLRAGCEAEGFRRVRTLLATGNVAFDTDEAQADVECKLAGVLRDYGLDNAFVVRRVEDMPTILSANPYADAAVDRPSRLLVHFLSHPAEESLPSWDGPERIAVRGSEAFVDYVNGVGRSRLTIGVLDRMLGSGGTARNWNTTRKLCDA